MPLSSATVSDLKPGDIALVGIPFDENGSFMRGPAKAPEWILRAIESESANYYTEDLIDLEFHDRFKTLGNAEYSGYQDISTPIRDILSKDAIPFSLGGDHSITFPIIRALAEKFTELTIIQFDAHGDLYDELDGNKYSHACPFARIMEDKLAGRLIQIGNRTLTRHQKEQADRFEVEIHPMNRFDREMKIETDAPVYITFDMDVFDPAFAPGVSHHEPGGLSVRDALTVIQSLDVNIVGADVVEYNPDRDINGVTSMVAAKIVKEIASKILKAN
jgi:agmatinase